MRMNLYLTRFDSKIYENLDQILDVLELHYSKKETYDLCTFPVERSFENPDARPLLKSFEKNNIQSEDYTYYTMLIRYGILDNMEFRLGWDFVEGVTKVNGNKLNNVMSGLSPLLLGLKIDIAEENGAMPEIALIGHVFPIFSASADYRPEYTSVDFRLSLSHTLSENSSLGYNIGAQWGEDSPEAAAIYTVAYGYSITDKFGAYAELYGDLPEDSSANHYWDAGFTYLVSNDFQLDAYFGTSITKGQDILLGLGFSYRIRKK